MSITVPPRGSITDELLSYLRLLEGTNPVVIGDGEVPAAGGWEGQPQRSLFTASVVLRTGVAVPNHRETLKGWHSSWRMSYGLQSIGGLRAQCDDIADLIRNGVLNFALSTVGPLAAWKVSSVVFTQLGPVAKVGNDENATWELQDSVELWVDRERT